MKVGAPFSDQVKVFVDSTTPGAVVSSGGIETDGDGTGVPKLDGTETVPASFGPMLGEGVGVAVETSIGVGMGVSDGLGGCPKATNASRDALRINPRKLFRMEWDRKFDARRPLRGFSQSMDYLLTLPGIARQSFVWQ